MESTLPVGIEGAREQDVLQTRLGQAALVVAGSALVAVCAHLSVPLWFTPVPLSLVNFAVVLVGLALGPVAGFSAMVLYLAEGASGLPVFSPHGLGGVAQLLGPTGGYLLAYPFAAAVAGWIARVAFSRRASFVAALIGSVAGTVLILSMGTAWLAHFNNVGPVAAFWLGMAPFLPGEVVKVAAASGIYTTLHRWYRG
ncbi:MAG: biotin transporter BioY [Acidobacteriaceae bacterium]